MPMRPTIINKTQHISLEQAIDDSEKEEPIG